MEITLEQLNDIMNLESRSDVILDGIKIQGVYYVTINSIIENGYHLSEWNVINLYANHDLDLVIKIERNEEE